MILFDILESYVLSNNKPQFSMVGPVIGSRIRTSSTCTIPLLTGEKPHPIDLPRVASAECFFFFFFFFFFVLFFQDPKAMQKNMS